MAHELNKINGGIFITDAKGKILYADNLVTSNDKVSFGEIYKKNPNKLWSDTLGGKVRKSPLSPLIRPHSPAIFLAALVEQHADIHSDEDADLINLAKTNPEHFQKLYEKYQVKVFNYFLYRLGKNVPMAEDLSQETFIRAFDSISHFEYRHIHYLSYLLTIAHNILVNYYRMSKPILMKDMDLLPIHIDSTAEEETEIKLLWEAAHQLNPTEEAILAMKYQEDWSVKEIAQKLHKSANSIKLHLSRARQKLRNYFA